MTKINITSGGGSTFTGGTIAGPLTVTAGPITISSGQFVAPIGSESVPGFTFSSNPAYVVGFYIANQYGSIRVNVGNDTSVMFATGSLVTKYPIEFGANVDAPDVYLLRDAANILAVQTGANAQALRIYTSYTNSTNYERLGINTAAGTITLAAETLGTGSDNINIVLSPTGTGNVTIKGDSTLPLLIRSDVAYQEVGISFQDRTYDRWDIVHKIQVDAPINRLGFYYNGTPMVTFLNSGQVNIHSGNGAYGFISSKQELVTTTAAGTALTAADFIPDGAIPLAISTYVQTAITITSLTGYKIGDGSDDDRWGAITGHAVGTKSNNADWTVTTVQAFTTAQAITLTSVGANFPAGGKIRVCMTYIASSEPTS